MTEGCNFSVTSSAVEVTAVKSVGLPFKASKAPNRSLENHISN